ncbi:hypothetical protein NE634_12730 [Lacrimispora saccharolytica]|nr:hypothetical protein [Lacrimispora saccharolytica]
MENEKGIVKLTRKQLYDEIWAVSVAGVARKYNLNYGKLIATCKVENIPFPSSGYWTKKNMGREYIQAMIDSGNEDITPEWIEWALKKADWYDPSIATEDEYLGKRQHEKSAEEKEKSLQDSIRKNWYW